MPRTESVHPVSIGLVRNAAGDCLLLGKKSASASWGAGLWEAPGGKAERVGRKWETPEATVVREVREEFGVEYTIEAKLATLWAMPTVVGTFDMHAFVGTIANTPVGLVHAPLQWWPLHEIEVGIRSGMMVQTFALWFQAYKLRLHALSR